MLTVVPCTIRAAKAFVADHHRHHPPPVGALFAVGVERDGALVGVAVVGRPVSRHMDDGKTAEVTRLCTDGSPNACSKLYGACWRAARALGWRTLSTYTLASEPGTSLRAAGWLRIRETSGGSWSRAGRPRQDKAPVTPKVLWQISR